METFLASIPYDQLPFGAMLTLAVISVFKGWLVPQGVVTDIRTDRDTRLTEVAGERDDWKAAYNVEREASSKKDAQINELLELAQTSAHVLKSLPAIEGEE